MNTSYRKRNFEQSPGHNEVVYPRAFSLDEMNPEKSYVDGVSESGAPVRVYLDPDKASMKSSNGTPPSILALAGSAPRSKPVICSSTNGPGSPSQAGILLFSKIKNQTEEGGFTVMRAGWAKILAHNAHSARPKQGIGFIHAHPVLAKGYAENESDVRHMHTQIARLESMARSYEQDSIERERIEAQLDSIQEQFDSAVRYRYSAVFIKSDMTEQLTPKIKENRELLEAKLAGMIDDQSGMGMLGGLIIRARHRTTNEVVEPASGRILPRYDIARARTQNPWDVAKSFLASPRGLQMLSLPDKEFAIDIIPLQSINAGPGGNSEIGREAINVKTRFQDPADYSPIAREICVPTTLTSDNAAILATQIYATSDSLGPILSLDAGGNEAYKLGNRLPRNNKDCIVQPGRTYVIMYDGVKVEATCKNHEGEARLFFPDDPSPVENPLVLKEINSQRQNTNSVTLG